MSQRTSVHFDLSILTSRPETCLVELRHKRLTAQRSSIAGLPCYQPPQLAVALCRQHSIGASRQLDCLVIGLASSAIGAAEM